MATAPEHAAAEQEAYAYIRNEYPNIDAEWAAKVAWLAAADWHEGICVDDGVTYRPSTPITMWVAHYVEALLKLACDLP